MRSTGFAAAVAFMVAVAGCASHEVTGNSANPGRSPAAGALPPASRHRLAAAYLAIARPANDKLDKAETGYSANRKTDLAAAEAALRSQAAIERGFDRQLAAIRFPPAIEETATALIRVNQIRIAFTLRQSRAHSVRAMLAFTAGHRAADAEVEAQVSTIRAQLGLPPPSTS